VRQERVKLEPSVVRLVALTCAIVGVDTVFFSALTPLLPHYAAAAGLSKAGAGILIAAYPAGTLLGSLPSGALVARFGDRTVAVAGLALMGVSTLAFGWTTSAGLLVAARLVQGIGGACTWTASLSWLATAAPESRRGELLGTAIGAAVVGALFGPVVGAVANVVGTGAAFSAASVLDAALIAVAFTVPSPRPQAPQSLRAALPALRDHEVVMGCWLMALAGIAFGMADVLAPLRLSRLGASGTVIAVTFLCAALAEAGVSPLAGRLSDRIGVARPLGVALVVGAAVALLLPLPTAAPLLIGLLIAGLPFYGALYAPASALVAGGAQRLGLNQGIAFAVSNLAWAAGQSVAASASGALAQATSDLVPYALLAACCLGTVMTLRTIVRPGAALTEPDALSARAQAAAGHAQTAPPDLLRQRMPRPARRREEGDHRVHDRGGVAERAGSARAVLTGHLEPEAQIACRAVEIAEAERAGHGKPEHRAWAPPGILRPATLRVVAHHPPRLRRGNVIAAQHGVLDPPGDEPVLRGPRLAPRSAPGEPAQFRAQGFVSPRLVELRVSGTAAATAAPLPVPDRCGTVTAGTAPAVRSGLGRRLVSVGGQRQRPPTPPRHRPTCLPGSRPAVSCRAIAA
jgi:MFS family permease